MLVNYPEAAQYPIDPTRLDLVEEFRRNPRGRHSDELRKILHRMRWSGDPTEAGRYILVVLEPGRRWALGRLPRVRGTPIEILSNRVFVSLDEAEWDVFKLRWQALTGQMLMQSLTEPVV